MPLHIVHLNVQQPILSKYKISYNIKLTFRKVCRICSCINDDNLMVQR